MEQKGGTAGCVAAGRLAKADPSLEILVVEYGIDTENDPRIVHPALFPALLAPNSNTTLVYDAKPSESLAGRAPVVHAGGCLGGGSSINFMMYTRAQGIDYDDWDTEGWSAKDLLPLFKKAS
jgi:alcohol oxidase